MNNALATPEQDPIWQPPPTHTPVVDIVGCFDTVGSILEWPGMDLRHILLQRYEKRNTS